MVLLVICRVFSLQSGTEIEGPKRKGFVHYLNLLKCDIILGPYSS